MVTSRRLSVVLFVTTLEQSVPIRTINASKSPVLVSLCAFVLWLVKALLARPLSL
jgi:hypothetical protein